jgi:hypothetical protein
MASRDDIVLPLGRRCVSPLNAVGWHAVSASHIISLACGTLTLLFLGLLLQDGWTPLHCAARAGYTEVVEQLLNADAFVDAADNVRHPPIHR